MPTLPLVDSTPLLDDPAALRARGEAEGYLFFRGLLPVDPLLELRGLMLDVIARHGLLRDDVPRREGRADVEKIAGETIVAGCTRAIYTDVQRLEAFHRIAHRPELLGLYRKLFDVEKASDVFVHPRHIARVLLPGPAARATPPHQDFVHVQGSAATWTAWFPLGDCPRELGGLSVLRRSHDKGILAVGDAEGAGGLATRLCPSEDDWLETDYAAGDVLTFPSTTVHKGLPNRLGDRVRLSCDLRYQRADQPIEAKSLQPHLNVLSWDEIYAGWERDDLKYYWQDDAPRLKPWDESVRWQKERICD